MSTGRRYALFATLLLTTWILAGWFGGRSLVTAAYDDRSLSFINDVIGGRDRHSVEHYLDLWRTAFLWITLALACVLALVPVFLRTRRTVGGRLRTLLRGPRDATLSPVDFMVAAVAFGLLAGYAEAMGVLVRVLGRGLPSWGAGYSAEVVWMAPVGYALLFGAAALILLPFSLLRRRSTALRPVFFLCALLVCYAVFRSFRAGFHPLALGLLAVGVSIQVTRAAEARAPIVRRLVRIWAGSGVAIALLLAIVLGVRARERQPSGEAPAHQISILWLILDTVRAANLGLYGHARATTPALDAFAAEAIVFDRALATSSWTLPSHGSMFTGRRSSELTADWERPIDATHPTIAEILAARGVRTGAFVANESYGSAISGLARGFQVYRDQPVSLEMLVSNSWALRKLVALALGRSEVIPPWGTWGRKRADEVNREFLNWLDEDDERPFFAFLNYMDAHHPYTTPVPYDTAFTGRRIPVRVDWADNYSVEELRQYEIAYDQAIRYMDAQFAQLIEELRRRDVLDHTLIVVTADHGEQFGERERNAVFHGRNLYMSGLHVPLIIALPGDTVPARRVVRPVSLVNLAATVLDVLGYDDAGIPGSSLARHWRTSGDGQRGAGELETGGTGSGQPILSELRRLNPGGAQVATWSQAMRSLYDDPFQYIRNGDGSEELYDLRADPWQWQPLAPSQLTDSLFDGFRLVLERMIASEPVPRRVRVTGIR